MKCVTSRNPKTADEICRKKNSPWQWSIVHYMSLRAFFAVLCNCCWPQHSTTLQTRKMCVITFQLFHTIRTKTIFVYEFYTFWQKEILFSIPCFAYNFLFFLFIILLYNCLFLYIKKTLKYWKLEKKNYWRNLKTSAFCAKICFTWFYLLLSLWATAGAWKENLLFYYLLYCSYRKKPPENRSHFSFLFFKEFEIENISKKVESKENL